MISFCSIHGQTEMDQKLALNYYSAGEYEKAVVYFEKVFPKYQNYSNFDKYYQSLIQLQRYKEAEKMTSKYLKKNPKDWRLIVYKGRALKEQGEIQKEQDLYESTISKINRTTTGMEISRFCTELQKQGYLDMALSAYIKANEFAASTTMYNTRIALIYGQQGKTELMVKTLIDVVEADERYFISVQNALSNAIDFEDDKKVNILKQELLLRSQKKPNEIIYNELLAWVYMLTKNYNGAFIQYKAIDKKGSYNGAKVYELGITCINNEAFDVAVKCFDHVLALGDKRPFYRQAKIYKVEALKKKVLQDGQYTSEDLVELEEIFESSLNELGKSSYSVNMIRELAKLKGYYLDKPSEGIELLEEARNLPGLNKKSIAEIKVDLGDLLVIDGRMWDASLLFMQVEKSFKEDKIGHQAKYKAAEIFYFSGNFEWCQAQLDVLKSSTSKLIANDAMELSMLITDNYNMDTTQRTMRMFARADLLIKQHKYEEALGTYDSITSLFTYHTLNDEILLKKSEIAMAQKNYDLAINHLEEIVKSYGTDILADNALFRLGEIYEKYVGNKAVAKEYYKEIMFEHPGSLFGVEARKRFRALAEDQATP